MTKENKDRLRYKLFVDVEGKRHLHVRTINRHLWIAKKKRLANLGYKFHTEYEILPKK
jgi:hypothetical protein